MIHARALTKTFGSKIAVDSLDLAVAEGEVFGFLGPNGAGKTTTVRMLAGLIGPSSGDASVAGYVVGRNDREIRQLVGVLTENPGLYGRLTARHNLDFFARLYGVPAEQRDGQVARYLDLLGLADRADESVGGFSKGMKQKLALARALVHEPKVIFLDEPTAALDPESARVVRDFIGEVRRQGRTVFLCTHNLDEAERLCDRIGIIKQRLLQVDTPARLRQGSGARRVRVQLRNANPRLATDLADLPFLAGISATTDGLLAVVRDPEQDNPALIRRLVELGAEVLFVTEDEPSLEDVYLKLVRGKVTQ